MFRISAKEDKERQGVLTEVEANEIAPIEVAHTIAYCTKLLKTFTDIKDKDLKKMVVEIMELINFDEADVEVITNE